jgi:hypothetical protein
MVVFGSLLLVLVLIILIVILLLLLLAQNRIALSSILVGELLCLSVAKCADSIGGTRQLVDAVGNLASTDQGNDNAGADNECQNEAVDSVPRRGPASLGGATVCIVEEVEGDELSNQSVFNRKEDCGPCDCGGPDTDGITLVAMGSTVASKLQTPVNSAKEGDDLRKESTS